MSYNKSLICPITGVSSELERALNETERFCAEEKLSHQQTLHMRLLAEEMMGMVGNLLNVNDGNYWIEKNDEGYELHLVVDASVGDSVRNILINVSTDKRNAAYAGIKGKLRQVMDAIALPAGAVTPVGQDSVIGTGIYQPTYVEWDYQAYISSLNADRKAAEWDALEKSVLGKLTRNIIIGVRPSSVHITLKAKL